MTTTTALPQWAGDPAIIGKRIMKEPEHADWAHLADKPHPVMGPTELGSLFATVNTALDLFDAQQAFRLDRGHAAIAAWHQRERVNAWQRRPWPSLVAEGVSGEPVRVEAEHAREGAAKQETGTLALAAAPTEDPADDTDSTEARG